MARFARPGCLAALTFLMCLVVSHPALSGENKPEFGSPSPVTILPERGSMPTGFNWPTNPCHGYRESLKQQIISVWHPHIELFRSPEVSHANLIGIDINSDGYVYDIKLVKADSNPYFNQSVLGAIAQIKTFKRMPRKCRAQGQNVHMVISFEYSRS